MKRFAEIFVIVSVILFLVIMCIIPVGGMAASNPNKDIYINLFAGAEILVFISFIALYFANRADNKKKSWD